MSGVGSGSVGDSAPQHSPQVLTFQQKSCDPIWSPTAAPLGPILRQNPTNRYPTVPPQVPQVPAELQGLVNLRLEPTWTVSLHSSQKKHCYHSTTFNCCEIEDRLLALGLNLLAVQLLKRDGTKSCARHEISSAVTAILLQNKRRKSDKGF